MGGSGRRRGMGLAGAAIVLLPLLLYVAVSLRLAAELTRPVRRPIDRTPAAFGLTYEDVAFPSRVDGLRLEGWLIEPRGAAPGGVAPRPVVMVHGRGADRLHELDGRFPEVAGAVAAG